MTVTVDVSADPNVRLTDVEVDVVPPDMVEFAIEGTATVSSSLLVTFEGQSLRPVSVALSAEGSPVVVDLEGEAALRLEAVDVGVETPESDDLPTGADDLESATDGVRDAADAADAGAIAFTLEGTIAGAAPDAVDAISAGSTTVESITFAVDEPLANDGGAGDDVVLELSLLGYAVVILRDGTITIRRA